MLSFTLSLGQTDRQKDRRTDTGKTICPQSSMRGHKNNQLDGQSSRKLTDVSVLKPYDIYSTLIHTSDNTGSRFVVLHKRPIHTVCSSTCFVLRETTPSSMAASRFKI